MGAVRQVAADPRRLQHSAEMLLATSYTSSRSPWGLIEKLHYSFKGGCGSGECGAPQEKCGPVRPRGDAAMQKCGWDVDWVRERL